MALTDFVLEVVGWELIEPLYDIADVVTFVLNWKEGIVEHRE